MKRFSFAVRAVLAVASLFVAGLGAAPAAQAELQFDGSPGNGAAPATLGGYTMVPSPQDSGADGTVIDAPATTTSRFTFDQPQQLLTVPEWCTSNWAGGSYAGRIYWTQGPNNVTITLPTPSSAVYFYAAPSQQYVPLNMNAIATAEDGTTAFSGDVPVTTRSCGGDTQASGQYFGFYGTNGDKIASITISLNDPNAFSSDFAFGDFALAGSQVVAVDDDLSLMEMPSDMAVDATSPAGAAVTYTAPTAGDEDSPASATVSCSTPSGSTFAIGPSTVTCTATDDDDTNSPVSQSFSVNVVGASGQLSDLANTVNGVQPGTSLPDKVAAAQSALAAGNAGGACQALDSFIAEAVVQTGKHVPATLGPSLVSAAQQIEAVLGCATNSTRQPSHRR